MSLSDLDPKAAASILAAWPAISAKLDERAHGLKPSREMRRHSQRQAVESAEKHGLGISKMARWQHGGDL